MLRHDSVPKNFHSVSDVDVFQGATITADLLGRTMGTSGSRIETFKALVLRSMFPRLGHVSSSWLSGFWYPFSSSSRETSNIW
jgi:hypothetical protein